MKCSHAFTKRPTTGQQDTCASCGIEYIHDGTRWVWKYELTAAKRAKLERIYTIDRATGKHS